MQNEWTRSATADEESWEPYVRAWRQRLEAERRARAFAADLARRSAQSAADVLVEQFGCSAVYLFGSLTGRSTAPFGPHSDIDLAVDDLPTSRYFEALTALENLFQPGTRFDLVRLEDAVPSLVARVQSTGEVLADGASIRGARR